MFSCSKNKIIIYEYECTDPYYMQVTQMNYYHYIVDLGNSFLKYQDFEKIKKYKEYKVDSLDFPEVQSLFRDSLYYQLEPELIFFDCFESSPFTFSNIENIKFFLKTPESTSFGTRDWVGTFKSSYFYNDKNQIYYFNKLDSVKFDEKLMFSLDRNDTLKTSSLALYYLYNQLYLPNLYISYSGEDTTIVINGENYDTWRFHGFGRVYNNEKSDVTVRTNLDSIPSYTQYDSRYDLFIDKKTKLLIYTSDIMSFFNFNENSYEQKLREQKLVNVYSFQMRSKNINKSIKQKVIEMYINKSKVIYKESYIGGPMPLLPHEEN